METWVRGQQKLVSLLLCFQKAYSLSKWEYRNCVGVTRSYCYEIQPSPHLSVHSSCNSDVSLSASVQLGYQVGLVRVIMETSNIFWSPQLHSVCVRDTSSLKSAYNLNRVQLRNFPLSLNQYLLQKAYKPIFLLRFVVSLILHIHPWVVPLLVRLWQKCQECSQISLLNKDNS